MTAEMQDAQLNVSLSALYCIQLAKKVDFWTHCNESVISIKLNAMLQVRTQKKCFSKNLICGGMINFE